ncbi:hypothetical protein niasHS_008225 [Heterodera schachtii]|uniref:PIPK domain-containing protein n=1 Tax=Heterodera schachtii TaxID=97005 RepID=A0ABD2JEK2_HETSC
MIILSTKLLTLSVLLLPILLGNEMPLALATDKKGRWRRKNKELGKKEKPKEKENQEEKENREEKEKRDQKEKREEKEKAKEKEYQEEKENREEKEKRDQKEKQEEKEKRDQKEKQEEKEKREEKAAEDTMYTKNGASLSTLLGNYLCQKLRAKGGEPRLGQNEEKLDYGVEKNVWTMPEKNSNEFNIRAEKLFELIRDKNGITDEQLLLSLSALVPLKERGGNSGGAFFKTKDRKFIVKNLNPKHDEPAKMDDVLDKYAAYVIDGVINFEKGEQSTEQINSNSNSKSMMNTMFMCFKMKLYAKLKEEDGNERKKVIRLHQLQFVVLNNVFEGFNEDNLLKFDIKGTSSPGSAVQHNRKQCRGEKGWQKCTYREFDFFGISRGGIQVAGFFPEGIQLSAEACGQLANRVKRDVHYLTTNGLNDYSLLLGVQFMDAPTAAGSNEDDEPPVDTNIGTKNCEIRAICHNCKRHPAADTKYEQKANLCLHMAIVDIVTPFNEKTEEHFLNMLKTKMKNGAAEFGHYKSMSEFTPYHNEIVSPVPPKIYWKRFVDTLFGCMFSPEAALTTAVPDRGTERQCELGMRQRICKWFGERRDAIVALSENLSNINLSRRPSSHSQVPYQIPPNATNSSRYSVQIPVTSNPFQLPHTFTPYPLTVPQMTNLSLQPSQQFH